MAAAKKRRPEETGQLAGVKDPGEMPSRAAGDVVELDADFEAQKALRQRKLDVERQIRQIEAEQNKGGLVGAAERRLADRDGLTNYERVTSAREPGFVDESGNETRAERRITDFQKKYPRLSKFIPDTVPDEELSPEQVDKYERNNQRVVDAKNAVGKVVRNNLKANDAALDKLPGGLGQKIRGATIDLQKVPGVQTLVGKDPLPGSQVPIVPTWKNTTVTEDAEATGLGGKTAALARGIKERAEAQRGRDGDVIELDEPDPSGYQEHPARGVAAAARRLRTRGVPASDATSDERAKRAIRAEGPLTKAAKALEGYEYEYKPEFTPDNQEPGEKNVGPMAQNMARNPVTATAVKEREDGLLRLDKTKLLKLNSAMIASQNKRIEALEGALTRAARK